MSAHVKIQRQGKSLQHFIYQECDALIRYIIPLIDLAVNIAVAF